MWFYKYIVYGLMSNIIHHRDHTFKLNYKEQSLRPISHRTNGLHGWQPDPIYTRVISVYQCGTDVMFVNDV